MTSQNLPFAQSASFLIVEDDMMIVTMIEFMLNDGGAKSISVASSVAEALSLIENNDYNVAVFDRQVRDGLSFSAAMKARERGAAIIIASGSKALDLPDKLSESIVIRKPFTLLEFERAVRLALTRR